MKYLLHLAGAVRQPVRGPKPASHNVCQAIPCAEHCNGSHSAWRMPPESNRQCSDDCAIQQGAAEELPPIPCPLAQISACITPLTLSHTVRSLPSTLSSYNRIIHLIKTGESQRSRLQSVSVKCTGITQQAFCKGAGCVGPHCSAGNERVICHNSHANQSKVQGSQQWHRGAEVF